ncbi:hypothetical protein BON22_4211 [Cyberlindnera fabianii]|uniref:TMEM14 protein n=1 Tax=Cyberlindnera fabianii TaxID=36022 RepID=A0A1V2L2E3_CYBFA|nr:hypothetical protein BON22_4211 [Cyberlindnera fabianii]
MEHPAYTLSALTAKSVPSLAAGLTFSAIYAGAGYLLHKNADYGLEVALGASTLLFAAGLARAIPTSFKKPIPVLLVTLGALGSGYYAKKYNEFYPIF